MSSTDKGRKAIAWLSFCLRHSWLAGILLILVMFMGIMLAVNGSEGTEEATAEAPSALNISPAVEAYRAIVEQECNANDIPECVDIILAIIMQESGASVPDVMQSSESKGLPPNSIRDPRESIQVGVAYFSVGYKQAKKDAKKNPKETAIQGYNYGGGFVGWAIENGGGWTPENAVEFARIKSDGQKRSGGVRDGQYAYGDQLYVQHVMAYLGPNVGENGGTGTTKGGSKAIEKAISTGSSIVGKSPYVWGGGRSTSDIQARRFDCSSFVRWCYSVAGIDLGPLSSTTTDTLVKKGEAVSQIEMKRGDLVFFDTYKVNGHVGIYLGDGKFINDNSSKGVWIDEMSNSYWSSTFKGVVRRVTK
ncbi:lytic transglycosylase [Listeria seeligeri]|uniref:bifunctional lytic transglycosylase/C40 family peptidase n=1 Tax=Listeria seeligeri TaxID=1640 RepID=UPI001626E895|nr:bifunctional lytic transglycosylase/C40 family peptidase [Listeria seeligeri]MBC1990384.1 lytic transglycosylase [Listeria seeligeri]